jgi:hypothetical protein
VRTAHSTRNEFEARLRIPIHRLGNGRSASRSLSGKSCGPHDCHIIPSLAHKRTNLHLGAMPPFHYATVPHDTQPRPRTEVPSGGRWEAVGPLVLADA